ncbi:MAG TPA: PAS domain S-box protein, partial [Geobacteraceae bacterium]|nr:PAS domain S-box protein [Geobacteraceae bacterium]
VFSEKQIMTADGRWFNVRIMPYRTLENKIDGVVMTFTDLTAVKKTEAELRQTGTMLRALVRAASFIIICLTADGHILEFNPEAERLLGRKRAEVLGQNYFELFLPKPDRKHAAAAMKEMLAASPARNVTTRVEAANGALLSIQWSAGQMLDADGKAAGIVAIGQDVTKKAED